VKKRLKVGAANPMTAMTYTDLRFEPHGFLDAAQVAAITTFWKALAHTAGAVRVVPSSPRAIVIERAEARFPNGHVLSILRGLVSAGCCQDFESCLMTGGGEIDPVKHRDIESVQREMDRVAAL
jgi:hypothetical protein